jgi:hypothetical protein
MASRLVSSFSEAATAFGSILLLEHGELLVGELCSGPTEHSSVLDRYTLF